MRAAQWAVVAGLVGARLYEVAFNWDYYGRYPGKILAVWEGGLAMHGGLIVGPLVGAWLAWRWGVPVLRALDVIAPSMILGQAIGRWGNFFNEEAFGAPTDLPWKLYISPTHRPLEFRQVDFFHPTFLYESLWNLAGVRAAGALDPAAAGALSGGALLLLHRALLGGPVRDRIGATRQLLDRAVPGGAARERGGRPGGGGGNPLGPAAAADRGAAGRGRAGSGYG